MYTCIGTVVLIRDDKIYVTEHGLKKYNLKVVLKKLY